MKILITGVAGFIGANLAEALLERGYEVIGIDNLSQGSLLNLRLCRQYEKFQFIQQDVLHESALLKAAEGCSVIYHLAAFKIPRYSDALDTLRINGIGSDIVAKVAVAHKAKLIAASTSDVYGKNTALPFREESDLVIGAPDVRRWAYAVSKLFEEQLLFAYHERFGIDVIPVRFFGGYGPYQHLSWWGGPQAVFINQALDNHPLELHGDGQQTRSFTYVTDHVEGLIRLLEVPEAVNQVFNLGSSDEVTIECLARTIWQMIRGDEPLKIHYIPYSHFGKYEDVRRRIPDTTRLQNVLGYCPRTPLIEGLQKTIAWQIQRRKDIQRLQQQKVA
jgi:UDP-glucose 4-epimerase